MMTSQQPQNTAPQSVNTPNTVAAWVKCPSCGGVLGVPLGSSQGPCVFCNSVIQVATVVRLAPLPNQQVTQQPVQQATQQHPAYAQQAPRQNGAFPVNQAGPVRLSPDAQEQAKRLDGR